MSRYKLKHEKDKESEWGGLVDKEQRQTYAKKKKKALKRNNKKAERQGCETVFKKNHLRKKDKERKANLLEKEGVLSVIKKKEKKGENRVCT